MEILVQSSTWLKAQAQGQWGVARPCMVVVGESPGIHLKVLGAGMQHEASKLGLPMQAPSQTLNSLSFWHHDFAFESLQKVKNETNITCGN